jgi:hypothetical protein
MGVLYAPITTEMKALINETAKEDISRGVDGSIWAKQVVDHLVKSDPPASS